MDVATATTASSVEVPLEARQRELELTILMPCLNEGETIGTCIRKAFTFLRRVSVEGEVLIADNGSTDNSIEIARLAGARVVSVGQKGYGAALMGGIEAARGRFIIMGDADDSYDFAKLDQFLDKLRAGFDVVVGNRFVGGIERGAMPWLHRYLGNPVLSFFGRHFFSLPIGDFHCGLRGFRREPIKSLQLQTMGMEFASEMIVKSGLKQLSIVEVPTTLKPDGRSRATHLKTWRDGWRHLKFLLMYSPKWLYFVPGLALTVIGVTMSGVLMFGPLHIGTLNLELNTFLAACLLSIVGVQIVTFGALARYYATVSEILPRSPRSDLILAICKTDYLTLIGFALAVVGLVMFGISLHAWASVDFGNLGSPLIPRLVAAGLSLMAIGVQLIFAAFMFGVLSIPRGANNKTNRG